MEARKTKIEIAMSGKYQDSEANLQALDNAFNDEDSRKFLLAHSSFRKEVQKRYRLCIRQTAVDLWQVSQYLFSKIADNEFSNVKEGDLAPENLKKLPMQVNKLSSLIIDQLLTAPDFNGRTIIMERWAAIMAQSLILGDFTTARAILGAFDIACINRLKITAGLSEFAKNMFELMSNKFKENILNIALDADNIIMNRDDLIIPYYGHYRSMLFGIKEQIDKLNESDLVKKYQILGHALEAAEQYNSVDAMQAERQTFTALIEGLRKTDQDIGSYATHVKQAEAKIKLGIDDKESKTELAQQKALLADAIRMKEQHLKLLRELWNKVLNKLSREQKEPFEKEWKENLADHKKNCDFFQAKFDKVVKDLNDKKSRLGGAIPFADLNDFQREIALGMPQAKFDAQEEPNYERSQRRLAKPAEAPVCELFRQSDFENLIFDDKLPLCIRSINHIGKLFQDRKALVAKLKEFNKRVDPDDTTTKLFLEIIIHNLEARLSVQETLHFLDAQYEVIKKEKNIHLDIIKIVKELKKLNKELTGVFNDIAKDNPSLPVLPKPVLLHSASTSQLKTEPAASGSEPPKGSYLKRGSTYVGSMLTFRGSKAREDSKKDLKAFANESTPRSTSFAAPSDQKKEKERKPSDAGADLSESDKKLKRTTSTASVSGSKIVNLSDRDKEKKPSRSLSQRVLSIVRSDPPEKDPKQNPDDNSGEPTPPSSSPSGKKGS